MSIVSAASQPQPRSEPVASLSATERSHVRNAFAFAGLSLGLAVGATLAGTPPALLPFILALGPTVFAMAFAWREGNGALTRLLRTAATRPSRRAWYVVVALPIAWAFATVGVAIVLGEPTAGLFDKVVPAIFIIPLVVLLPAFAEEIAWRGYAVTRLLPAMSPLAAALVIAGPWALMHVFLQLPGQMNAGLEVWPTLLSLVGYSVVLTWVFLGSGGSVLLTALVHAGFNGFVPLMGGIDFDLAWAVRALLIAAVAIAIVAAGGLRRPAPHGKAG
jgi:CAAX protease family protein